MNAEASPIDPTLNAWKSVRIHNLPLLDSWQAFITEQNIPPAEAARLMPLWRKMTQAFEEQREGLEKMIRLLENRMLDRESGMAALLQVLVKLETLKGLELCRCSEKSELISDGLDIALEALRYQIDIVSKGIPSTSNS